MIDDAEEEECKEALLGYFFLLRSAEGMTTAALDDAIKEWCTDRLQTNLDFEVADAMAKLRALSLCRVTGRTASGEEIHQAVPLDAACRHLDRIWDGYFTAS